MHGLVGNITVLFSHCFKKKAALQGSINREIRTLSCDKTVRGASIEFCSTKFAHLSQR